MTILEAAEARRATVLAEVGDTVLDPLTMFELTLFAPGDWPSNSRLGFMNLYGPFGIQLLLQALHGREVLDGDGMFIFPPAVTRVFIDVGAHHCGWTPALVMTSGGLRLACVSPPSCR